MTKIWVRFADEKGKIREASFEGSSETEIRNALKDQGYYILEEEIQSVRFTEKISEIIFGKKSISLVELVEFIKLLRTMLKAGLPMTESLDILISDAPTTRLNTALKRIKSELEEGISFSRALSRHPDVFPNIFVKTIIAGEKAGALPEVLKRLAEYFSNTIAIRRKLISALIYPAVLLVIASAAVIFMLVKVVPEFAGLFTSLDVPLPLFTQIVLDTSSFLGRWIIPFLIFLPFGIYLLKTLFKTGAGRLSFDRFKLKLPLIGALERRFAFSQFSRMLSVMLHGGLPLLECLSVVIATLENKQVADNFSELTMLLEHGESFGKSLKSVPDVPLMMSKIVHVGEESGNLNEMLGNMADFFDDEISEITATLTALIEPAIFLMIAGVVGTIVIALLMPILTAAGHIK